MANLSSLLKEAGVIAGDVAKFTNQTLNQTASQAAGGVAGLAAAGVEAVRGGDPGAAFRAVQENVTARTTLPAPEYKSNLATAVAETAAPFAQSAAVGMQEMATTTGQYYEEATGSTRVGGITAAVASIATDALEMVSKVPLPKGGVLKKDIIGGRQAAKKIKGEKALQAAQADADAGLSNREMLKKHGMWKDDTGTLRVWIDDDAATLNHRALGVRKLAELDGKTVTHTLGDLVSHEALYKVYPTLRKAKVNITFDSNLAGERYYGDFDPETNTITVSAAPNEVMRPLLHEIQHWVQKKEKLINGTSAKWETIAVLRNPRLVDMEGGRSMAAKYQQIEQLIDDYLTKADSDVTEAEYDALLVAKDHIDGYARYRGQVAEREASAAEAAYRAGPRLPDGTLDADPLKKAESVLDAVDNAVDADGRPIRSRSVMESTPGSLDEFLDRNPSLWGNRLALEHITDDPALVDKYANMDAPQNIIRGFRDGHIAEAQAWHGARDRFESFMLKFMGSGEGAQMYGWGIYATKKFGVAAEYRNARHTENKQDKARRASSSTKRIVFDMDNPREVVVTPTGESFTFDWTTQGGSLAGLVGESNVARLMDALVDGPDRERLLALDIHNEKMDEFAKRIDELNTGDAEYESTVWSAEPLVWLRGKIRPRMDGSLDFGLSGGGVRPERFDSSVATLEKIAAQGTRSSAIAKEMLEYVKSEVSYEKLGKLREDTVYTKRPPVAYSGPEATMYELDVPEDHEMLLWHKTFDEQSPEIQDKLTKVFTEVYYNTDDVYRNSGIDMTDASRSYLRSINRENTRWSYDTENFFGREVQKNLEDKILNMDWDEVRNDDIFGIKSLMEKHGRDINMAGADEVLSFIKLKHGIPGHLFKPEQVRGSHENYVIYDTERIKIIDKDHDPKELSKRAREREALKNKEKGK